MSSPSSPVFDATPKSNDNNSPNNENDSISSDDNKYDNNIINGWDSSYMGCRSIQCYKMLNKIDEGSYGKVFRVKDIKTGDVYAVKKIKVDPNQGNGFPITSLREINVLLEIKHPNIIGLREIVVDPRTRNIFMVMEYMPHDMKILLKSMKRQFSTSEVKCLMKQLLEGVSILHEHWVIHRDLKSSNILFDNRGILKICDFGLARRYGSPIGKYTQLVVTLWYRAPELLLGTTEYTTAIDMWSVGCIMYELFTRKPLFPGDGEINQLKKIFEVLGSPNEDIWPGCSQLKAMKDWTFKIKQKEILRDKIPALNILSGAVLSDAGYDLWSRMLTLDPKQRISANDALNHPWFVEQPRAQDAIMMPSFPSLNEDVQKRHAVLSDHIK